MTTGNSRLKIPNILVRFLNSRCSALPGFFLRMLSAWLLAVTLTSAAYGFYEPNVDLLQERLSYNLRTWSQRHPERQLNLSQDEYHLGIIAQALDHQFTKIDQSNNRVNLSTRNQMFIVAYLSDLIVRLYSSPHQPARRGASEPAFFGLGFWSVVFDDITDLMLETLNLPGYHMVAYALPPAFPPDYVPPVPHQPTVSATAVPRHPRARHQPQRLPAAPQLQPQHLPLAPQNAPALNDAAERERAALAEEHERNKRELVRLTRQVRHLTHELHAVQRQYRQSGFEITEPTELWLAQQAAAVPLVPNTQLPRQIAPPKGKKKGKASSTPVRVNPSDILLAEQEQMLINNLSPGNRPIDDARKDDAPEAPEPTVKDDARVSSGVASKLAGSTAAAAAKAGRKNVGKIIRAHRQPGRFTRIRSLLQIPAAVGVTVGVAVWYLQDWLFERDEPQAEPKAASPARKPKLRPSSQPKQLQPKQPLPEPQVHCDTDFKTNIVIHLCRVFDKSERHDNELLLEALDKKLQAINDKYVLNNMLFRVTAPPQQPNQPPRVIGYRTGLKNLTRMSEVGVNDPRLYILALSIKAFLEKQIPESMSHHQSLVDLQSGVVSDVIEMVGFMNFFDASGRAIAASDDLYFAARVMYETYFKFVIHEYDSFWWPSYDRLSHSSVVVGLRSHRRFVAALNSPQFKISDANDSGLQLRGFSAPVIIMNYRPGETMALTVLRYLHVFIPDREPPAATIKHQQPYNWITITGLRPDTRYSIIYPTFQSEQRTPEQWLEIEREKTFVRTSPAGTLRLERLPTKPYILLTEQEPGGVTDRAPKELFIVSNELPEQDEQLLDNNYKYFYIDPDFRYYYSYQVYGRDNEDLSMVRVYMHKSPREPLVPLASDPYAHE